MAASECCCETADQTGELAAPAGMCAARVASDANADRPIHRAVARHVAFDRIDAGIAGAGYRVERIEN